MPNMPNGAASSDSTHSRNALPNPWWNKPIHDQRQIKVISIGAGASGLIFAYKLQRSFENFDLVLYEKNEEIGGTWLENKYPGSVTANFPIAITQYAILVSQIAAHAISRPTLTLGLLIPIPTGPASTQAPTKSRNTFCASPRNMTCANTVPSTNAFPVLNGTAQRDNGILR